MEPSTMQVPTSKPKTSPKDFFLNLGAILSLYIVAVSFITFIFQVIDTAFPDRQNYSYDPYSGALRMAVATLIVFFPILLILGRLIHKDILANPVKRDLTLRKWLIYITLFVTGLTIAVDLVVLLNTFLSGEVTTRFILKVISVFITAGLIFWYYISDLKGRFYDAPKKLNIFYTLVTIIVLASIVTGFLFIGSPQSQRLLRDDDQRVQDLEGIQWQVISEYQQTGVVPVTLQQVEDPIRSYMIPKDPSTQAPYEYKVTPGAQPSFELCATFALKSKPQPYQNTIGYYGGTQNESWMHEAGRQCFTRIIDPAKYPIYPKNPATTIPTR